MDKDNNTIESKPSTKEEHSMSGGMDKSPGVGDGAMEEEEEEEDAVLPGFRFHPTDEELVGFYLRRKVGKRPLSIELIKQIDIYKHDPWDLPKVSTAGENEWYFFCLRGRKYRNSIRPNRVTGSGFWKATGIDRPIYPSSGNGECIGLKKSLVYYRGSAGKGVKTDWMMHEFRLPSSNKNDSSNSSTIQEAEIWTICRIFKRNVTYKKYPQSWKESSTKQASTESNSKTSSFESDGSDGPNGYRFCYNTSAVQQGERPVTTYNFGEANQLYAGQWNAATQAPQTATYPQIQNPSATDVYREGNWDELGRIMEYMMDPAFAYECSS